MVAVMTRTDTNETPLQAALGLSLLVATGACTPSVTVGGAPQPTAAASETPPPQLSAAPSAEAAAIAAPAPPRADPFKKVSYSFGGRRFTFLQRASDPPAIPALKVSMKAAAEDKEANVTFQWAGRDDKVAAGKDKLVAGAEGSGRVTLGFDFSLLDGVEHPIGRVDFVRWYADESGMPADMPRIPAKYRPLGRAFGIVNIGCTATHVGAGVVLTAGHCVLAEPVQQPVKDEACPDGLAVTWSYTYLKWSKNGPMATLPKAGDVSPCFRILAAEWDANKDYAILQVDNPPSASVVVDLDARAETDREVTIFGHPAWRPLEWSGTCRVRPSADLPWQIYHRPARFGHKCDTEPISSGSPVIDTASLKIVGIHDGGLPTERLPDGTEDGWNWGTFVSDTPLRSYLK